MNGTRREFLKTTAAASAAAAAGVFPANLAAKENGRGVAIIIVPQLLAEKPVRWAGEQLRDALTARGVTATIFESLEQTPPGFECVLVLSPVFGSAPQLLDSAGISLPHRPETLGLGWGKAGNRRVLLACGSDTRGLVYALLELADRVGLAPNPLVALQNAKPVVESPANAIRSLARCFVSEVEDKPWFSDRDMWPRYLTTLATQRFNRFNLSFGIGYDFLQNVTDAYLLFAYPFLLSVPGYDVRAPELPDAERDRNLETLRFISEQTVARGLHFQLGLWMHGYQWLNSPNPNYTISGLTRENHGPYCREAMTALLKACPAISGVTLRIHGESGVSEGSYDFWKMVFEGVASSGRPVEIDLHAKGIDQTMIDLALATGMPVNVAPKYWAEHLGMPYHQAEIRATERPNPGREGSGLMKLSSGSRSFLRYGYGDLLKENRRYTVMHRIWPGTQRLLLWGDPITGAAYSRAFSFCDSAGVEIMEPLTFKGRRGSGIAGDRCGYADASLTPHWDWEKYLYTTRIWGRLLYNPDTDAETWQRLLRKQFGLAAKPIEAALAHASRILPTITTAHAPSAANNVYWPEMYFNQSLVEPRSGEPYEDTPSPKLFGNVSPLDPQLFLSVNDFARELLNAERSGKYSPIEVAQWIEDHAEQANKQLGEAEKTASNKQNPEYRRMIADVKLQIGLGRFFGAKFRCGVLYAIFQQTGNRDALVEALRTYQLARNAWAELSNSARGVYRPDVTVGELPQLRGHWVDRLTGIDKDIAKMRKQLEQAGTSADPDPRAKGWVAEALRRPRRAILEGHHTPASSFHSGEPLPIELVLRQTPVAAKLYFRHVNQGERYKASVMTLDRNRCQATIPASYTDSPYPLEYYFEVKLGAKDVSLFPGFAPSLANQPYFVVRHSRLENDIHVEH